MQLTASVVPLNIIEIRINLLLEDLQFKILYIYIYIYLNSLIYVLHKLAPTLARVQEFKLRRWRGGMSIAMDPASGA